MVLRVNLDAVEKRKYPCLEFQSSIPVTILTELTRLKFLMTGEEDRYYGLKGL
jgi:hypothetical protein